ncbi:hypothetical protein HELRODRAFT_159677 [Helobdella robusta]|uniref:Fucolectin tachylectin-4 pentraxin-1 domain-containing protein n=1 Tax=Helobdella robusta TaxID=6412 RepID=T1EPA8_HELRO|nr:hypothetical protein HELRODRAFT_159677 [Helobdella robusta]ESO13077.1 hypothetical protein HELRODRAFT_159677 [Helobdella robusta]
MAVDGIRSSVYSPDGRFFCEGGPPNWIVVQLADVFSIYYILLVNSNTAGSRLSKYIVGLNRSLGSVVNRWDYDLCGQYPRGTENSTWYITLCQSYSYGHRYVIVQSASDTDRYLTLCELEVYGR